MSWREAASARRAGSANSGVPAKAMRKSLRLSGASDRGIAAAGSSRARLALPALLVEFLADALALEVGEIVHEQLAVEVIHLVLEAHREKTLEIALERLALTVLGAHADLRGPLHLVEDPGHREAALLGLRGALAAHDLGIH